MTQTVARLNVPLATPQTKSQTTRPFITAMANISQDATSKPNSPDVSAQRLKFEALTQHLERVALDNPTGYNRRVAALAMLGYAYIFGVLLVCAALIGVLVWIVIIGHHFNVGFLKIGFFLLIFTFIIVKSLFVKMEPPAGRELTRDEGAATVRTR